MLTKILVAYSTVVTTVLAALALAGPAAAKVQRFDEIDVHRVNVREPDGTLRLVMSNHARLPGDSEGVASVWLMDRNGRRRMLLQVTPDGTPSLSFLDADGKIVNQLASTRSQ